jgi:hypothetical protein
VHIEQNLAPFVGKFVKARERDEHFVTNAMDVKENEVRFLAEKRAPELAYHLEIAALIKTQVNITQKIDGKLRLK